MQVTKIRFSNHEATLFAQEVKTQVAAYFEVTGRSSKANSRMVFKTIIFLLITYGSYGLILSNQFSAWQMLWLAVLMGVGIAGIGFCIAHDALHGAYSANPQVNKFIGYTFDLLGANGYIWKIAHNTIHHTYSNIPGIDQDLMVSPLIRFSSATPLKPIHKYQHIYAFFAYSFATLNWLFMKDFLCFQLRDFGPCKDLVHSRAEVVNLIWTKLFVYAYTIAIPLLILDVTWWQFLIGFVVMHITAGLILGVVFQLAHVVEGLEFPVPDENDAIEHTWLIHQMVTTANFAHENQLLSWFIGGLNYQIEHHLFPQVCSIHYPAISQIVREVAQKHGVPYNYYPTFFGAIKSHYFMLKKLGDPHTEINTNPSLCS
ncbi:acyl-CoA desaturase [Nostoc sp. CHAB 5824]|nr:acyl-CoA desaturase [Nostoc sp. CHAB 5824]